ELFLVSAARVGIFRARLEQLQEGGAIGVGFIHHFGHGGEAREEERVLIEGHIGCQWIGLWLDRFDQRLPIHFTHSDARKARDRGLACAGSILNLRAIMPLQSVLGTKNRPLTIVSFGARMAMTWFWYKRLTGSHELRLSPPR